MVSLPFGESDPAPPAQKILRSFLHSCLGRRPGAPKWVPGQARGLRREWRRCVVQFLDKDVDVPLVCDVAGLIVVCQRHRSWGNRGGGAARAVRRWS